MPKPDCGPAFPFEEVEEIDGEWMSRKHLGMSLRDYFAAQCYQVTLGHDGHEDFIGAARDAYHRADAMMHERTKEE